MQTTLATFQGAPDEDAWSSSDDEEPQGTSGGASDLRAGGHPRNGASTSKAAGNSNKRAAAQPAGPSKKRENGKVCRSIHACVVGVNVCIWLDVAATRTT